MEICKCHTYQKYFIKSPIKARTKARIATTCYNIKLNSTNYASLTSTHTTHTCTCARTHTHALFLVYSNDLPENQILMAELFADDTAVILGGSGRVVNSLDFCPVSLKSLGCFYFRCILSSQRNIGRR